MRRLERFSLPLLLFLAAPAFGATVTVTPSASTVAAGTEVTFTVSATPSSDISQVAIQYDGESTQDAATAAPATFTHTFSSASAGSTVTATVSYSNGEANATASTDVHVVGITLTGPSDPLRAWPCTYTAQANPPGSQMGQVSWSYQWAGGSNNYTDPNLDGGNLSSWSGRMVVAGTLSCTAVVAGVQAQAVLSINPAPRVWSVPISCYEDNEVWGEPPYADVELSKNRDRDSNEPGYVFSPRSVNSFRSAWTMGSVTSGPCAGWYYVANSTLKVQRETAINQYVKGGALGGSSFAEANYCLYPGPADFVLALKHHEYRGTPEVEMSPNGHQGRLEQCIRQFDCDAKQHIEGLVNRLSNDLINQVQVTIESDDAAVRDYGLDEFYMREYMPNWGWSPSALGLGQISRWDGSSWTDCSNAPDRF